MSQIQTIKLKNLTKIP